ncbi:hypothetical protein FOA52_009760 [Chlamydomonas sp. UWO 241]|nr:hypothetical protein FOA52_009760 [Chlamydomonas sp. UWO 241]
MSHYIVKPAAGLGAARAAQTADMAPGTPQRNKANPVDMARDSSAHSSSSQATVGSPPPPGFFPVNCSEGKRYTVHEVIGKGSYGTVCAATDNQTGERVAIKRISNVFDNVADAVRILREVKLLRLLRHPDVVQVKHIMLPSDPRTYRDIYVVFELMESDMYTVINVNDDLSPDHHKVFMYQLLRGLGSMHERGVLHRDLKPRNILVNSNCKLKICDFGLARPFLEGNTPCAWTDYVATRWYRAPELCGCFYGRYSTAVDMWGLGCIFAEVLQGKPLFPGRDAVSQLQMMTDLLGKPLPHVIERISNRKARAFLSSMPEKAPIPFSTKFPGADPEALQLLKGILQFDASERLTAPEALKLPFFKDLPAANFSDATPITSAQFAFESQQLTESDVRDLIYTEVLNYHPEIQALYVAGSCRLPRALSAHGIDVGHDVKGQFLHAEASYTAAAAAASNGNGDGHPSNGNGNGGGHPSNGHPDVQWKGGQHAAHEGANVGPAPGHGHYHPVPGQVPAYRPPGSPAGYGLASAASAAAVQAVREHTAAMAYHQSGGGGGAQAMQYSPQYTDAYVRRSLTTALSAHSPHMMVAQGVASFV